MLVTTISIYNTAEPHNRKKPIKSEESSNWLILTKLMHEMKRIFPCGIIGAYSHNNNLVR